MALTSANYSPTHHQTVSLRVPEPRATLDIALPTRGPKTWPHTPACWGPQGPAARDPETQLHLPVGRHQLQNPGCPAPPTPHQQACFNLRTRASLHPPVSRHEPKVNLSPAAHHGRVKPTHQQSSTSPGPVGPSPQQQVNSSEESWALQPSSPPAPLTRELRQASGHSGPPSQL